MMSVGLGGLSFIFTDITDGNMSGTVGDTADYINNRKRVQDKLPSVRNICAKVEHEYVIKNADADLLDGIAKPRLDMYHCDALFADMKNNNIWLFPADCIPLIIYCDDLSFAGVVHVSRITVVTNLLRHSVEYFLSVTNCELASARFYFGPSISKDHYVFPPDIASELFDESWAQFSESDVDGVHIDVRSRALQILRDLGIGMDRIEISSIDTASGKYFSQSLGRKSKAAVGRNLAVLCSTLG